MTNEQSESSFLFTVYLTDPLIKKEVMAETWKIYDGRLVLAIGDPNIVKNTVAMFNNWSYFTRDGLRVDK